MHGLALFKGCVDYLQHFWEHSYSLYMRAAFDQYIAVLSVSSYLIWSIDHIATLNPPPPHTH